MQNIVIENKKAFTGSVNWLKEELSKTNFRFGSRDGQPTVDYAFISTDKDTGKEKLGPWRTAVIMAETPSLQYNYSDVCDKYDTTFITFPSDNICNEHQWAMFPFLTPNAQNFCKRLIKSLADELIKNVKGDKGELKITVTVE